MIPKTCIVCQKFNSEDAASCTYCGGNLADVYTSSYSLGDLRTVYAAFIVGFFTMVIVSILRLYFEG